jgi:outer membrane lipoprotein-sorting protein
MKTKHILIIFIVLITLFFLWSCGEASKKVTGPDIQVSLEDSKGSSSDTSRDCRKRYQLKVVFL